MKQKYLLPVTEHVTHHATSGKTTPESRATAPSVPPRSRPAARIAVRTGTASVASAKSTSETGNIPTHSRATSAVIRIIVVGRAKLKNPN